MTFVIFSTFTLYFFLCLIRQFRISHFQPPVSRRLLVFMPPVSKTSKSVPIKSTAFVRFKIPGKKGFIHIFTLFLYRTIRQPFVQKCEHSYALLSLLFGSSRREAVAFFEVGNLSTCEAGKTGLLQLLMLWRGRWT